MDLYVAQRHALLKTKDHSQAMATLQAQEKVYAMDYLSLFIEGDSSPTPQELPTLIMATPIRSFLILDPTMRQQYETIKL